MSDSTSDSRAALTASDFARFAESFNSRPIARIAQNAVTQLTAEDVALDRAVVTGSDASFSHKLDDWAATAQKKSGRCWLFAGLNLLRAAAMKKMNLKDFEFSQNHAFFWDKFERANYFFESMIELADRPVDDRTIAYMLAMPLSDGGQWNMFVNLLGKHGVVPKSAMPETESSSNSGRMNAILSELLRQGARRLRELHRRGTSTDGLREAKMEMLEAIHRVLCIHLGTPPSRFDWQWNDKDNQFHRDGEMTPQEFAAKYIETPLDEYVCLVHDPRPTSPIGKTFTVDRLGNVIGGAIVRYLSVDIGLMKNVAMKSIVEGEPVWFGCDVGKQMRRDIGLWDAHLIDYSSLYDVDFTMSKADRLIYHQTQMTHAMLFTGVDVVDGKPRRWRVENSWGDDNGKKGFYVMNDSWFDEHMFEIAARKSWLPSEMIAALAEEPIVLPAWDPMGSLA
ncbi:MAG: aminopeptidase C [Gemmataceae bacterium]